MDFGEVTFRNGAVSVDIETGSLIGVQKVPLGRSGRASPSRIR